MLDWQVEMVEKKHRLQVLLSDVEQDSVMASSLGISSVEASAIDGNLERRIVASSKTVQPLYQERHIPLDQISSVIAGVDPGLNDGVLYQ